VVGHHSVRDSMKGTLWGGGSFTGEMRFFIDMQSVCKWVSLSIGALSGEPGGGSLAGTFERKS
jgi:hypothetical protein